MKPLVGITGRRIRSGLVQGIDPRFADVALDIFYTDFATRIDAAGGLAVQLPYESDDAEIVDRLDALLLTGGQDVDPARWGGQPSRAEGEGALRIDPLRDEYETTLTLAALAKGIPVLGICRGAQILNVALGGTLIPDLPPGPILHSSPHSAPDEHGKRAHPSSFVPGSIAHSLYGPHAPVSSWHHQAVDTLGSSLVVTGRAPDGVVEAIEIPGRAVLGVQWHPEMHPGVDRSFEWLVSAASIHVGQLVSTPSTT